MPKLIWCVNKCVQLQTQYYKCRNSDLNCGPIDVSSTLTKTRLWFEGGFGDVFFIKVIWVFVLVFVSTICLTRPLTKQLCILHKYTTACNYTKWGAKKYKLTRHVSVGHFYPQQQETLAPKICTLVFPNHVSGKGHQVQHRCQFFHKWPLETAVGPWTGVFFPPYLSATVIYWANDLLTAGFCL